MALFGKSKSEKQKEAILLLAATMGGIPHTITQEIADLEGTADTVVKMELHMEVLAFFCHYLSRTALSVGGPNFRADLQDLVVPLVIDTTIEVSTGGSRGSTPEKYESWKTGFKGNFLELIDLRELELAECKSLGLSESEMKAFSFTNTATMVGVLAAKIDELLGTEDHLATRMNVALATAKGLAASKMSTKIEEIWKNR